MKKIVQALTFIITSAFCIPTLLSAPLLKNELPHDQIEKFVRAIAIINHYYIKKTGNTVLFANAIRGMVTHLDPHSTYLDKADLKELQAAVSGEFVGIGVELTTQDGTLKVISPLQGTPAEQAGIKPEDLIIKIDGKLVQNLSLRQAIHAIKGKPGSKVTLTVLRKNQKKPITLTIKRNTIKLLTLKKELLNKHYGYIRITFFQGTAYHLLKKALSQLLKASEGKLYGLILDLRNNPGGLLNVSAKVADAFLDARQLKGRYKNQIVYTKGRMQGSDMVLKATAGDRIPGVPIVVMINGGSASASEIVAGALQDYKRAVIIGTQSFGKGSVQTVLPISDTAAIKLTTALYHTPSGRIIQAKGIRPDVWVPQLTVSKKNTRPLFDIDENDYHNHLAPLTDKNQTPLDLAKSLHQREWQLAEQDYQLYEALVILKGMHAIKH